MRAQPVSRYDRQVVTVGQLEEPPHQSGLIALGFARRIDNPPSLRNPSEVRGERDGEGSWGGTGHFGSSETACTIAFTTDSRTSRPAGASAPISAARGAATKKPRTAPRRSPASALHCAKATGKRASRMPG